MLSAFVDICYYIMDIQIATMEESYLKSYSAFYDRESYQEMFANALSKIFTDVKLGGVRSCLAIGAGDGWCEIEFIKHSGANISKFIGIEPDHDSAEHLRTSLRSSLPGVESQVLESKIQNWEGPGEPVDLVMMFQVLYYISAEERQKLLKKVHDSWLASGGYVALVTGRRTKAPNSAEKISENLGLPPRGMWEETAADFQKAGFTKQCEQEMQWTKDVTDHSIEDLLPFFQRKFKDRIVTLAELRDAMKGHISEGKMRTFCTLAIFKSTN